MAKEDAIAKVVGEEIGSVSFEQCENEKEDEESQEDIMDDSNHTQPLLSSRQQLAACAKMLVKEEKGSDKYNDLLDSFSQLGLTKENLQNSLKG